MKKLLFVVCLGACGSQSHTATVQDALVAQENLVDRADFVSSTEIAQNTAPDVKVTVSGDAARSLYVSTVSLAPAPTGPVSCPADFGVTYTITFWSGTTTVATATLDPNGCEGVLIDSTKGTLALSATSGYFGDVAADLGIQTSVIYPYLAPET